MQLISQKAIDRIKGNHKCFGRLVTLFDKHPDTISNWLRSRDIKLATPSALEIIKEETGLKEKDILETEIGGTKSTRVKIIRSPLISDRRVKKNVKLTQ